MMVSMLLRALTVVMSALAAASASAQQYRWLDENGRVHYSDTSPPATAKGIQKKYLNARTVASAAGKPAAEQYRWVDENDGVNYSDTMPPTAAKKVQKRNFKSNSVAMQPNYTLSQAVKNYPVTLYTHPDCREACRMARDALNKRGVPFTEVSVTDTQKYEELQRVSGGRSLPVLVIGAQVQTEASEDDYHQALDLAGYPKAVVPTHRP